MLKVNNLVGGNVRPWVYKLVDSGSPDSGAATDTHTWSGVDIGPARADRRVVVALAYRDNASQNSAVAVGGVSLSVDQITDAEPDSSNSVIYSALVGAGSVVDVVVTFDSATDGTAAAIYSLYGLTPDAGGVDAQAAQTTVTQTLDVSVGSVAIAATHHNSNDGAAQGWAAGLSLDIAQQIEATGRYANMGSALFASAGSTAMTTDTGASATRGGCFQVYDP